MTLWYLQIVSRYEHLPLLREAPNMVFDLVQIHYGCVKILFQGFDSRVPIRLWRASIFSILDRGESSCKFGVGNSKRKRHQYTQHCTVDERTKTRNLREFKCNLEVVGQLQNHERNLDP